MKIALLVAVISLIGCNGKTWQGWQVCEMSATPYYGVEQNHSNDYTGGFDEAFSGTISTDGKGAGNDNEAVFDFTRTRAAGVTGSSNKSNHRGGVAATFKVCQAQRMVVIERRALVDEAGYPKRPLDE